MCDFLSYIVAEGMVIYLDDESAYSKHSREVFKDCRDNDLLGHGAILKYFNLSRARGKCFEHRDFWNVEKFPEELQVKLKNFEKHWPKLLKNCMTKGDIEYVINNAPKDIVDRFIKMMKIDPYDYLTAESKVIWNLKYKDEADLTITDIRQLRINNLISFRAAAELLLRGEYNRWDLEWIIEYVPLKRDEACDAFLKLDLSGNMMADHTIIIKYGNDYYANKAYEEILKYDNDKMWSRLICKTFLSNEVLLERKFQKYKVMAINEIIKRAESDLYLTDKTIIQALQNTYTYCLAKVKSSGINNDVILDKQHSLRLRKRIQELLLGKFCGKCEKKKQIRMEYYELGNIDFCGYCNPELKKIICK